MCSCNALNPALVLINPNALSESKPIICPAPNVANNTVAASLLLIPAFSAASIIPLAHIVVSVKREAAAPKVSPINAFANGLPTNLPYCCPILADCPAIVPPSPAILANLVAPIPIPAPNIN